MKQWKQNILRRPYVALAIIIVTALVVRLLVSAFTYNDVDLAKYNINWCLGMQDGFFSCYFNIDNLNYPPLFPVLSAPLAPMLAWAEANEIWQLSMLIIKFIPVVFDVLMIPVIYFALKKQSEAKALLAALIWACNPVTFFNSAVWGQLDSMLCFFLGLTFLLFYQKRPVWGTVVFAVGCLAKLQMLYLAPVVLCELFFRYRPGRALHSLFAGVGVGIAGWLPFMIGSFNMLLPFEIYFGGFSEYKEMSLYAYNLWGLPFFSGVTTETPLFRFSALTYGDIGVAFLAILVLCVIVIYCYTARKKIEIPAFFTAMIYLDGIFFLTAGQHERYQIPVMILAMLCWMFLQDSRFKTILALLLTIPFINEVFGIVNFWLNARWFQNSFFKWGQLAGSVLNLLLFAYLVYLLIRFLTQSTERERLLGAHRQHSVAS